MDELYKQRQDFKVWVPLLTQSIRPYIYTDKFNKQDYYEHLSKCRVGFAPKQVYGGWSVAAMDGLANGLPYIFFNAPYYSELYYDGDFFKNKKEALIWLNKYLDDSGYRNKRATDALDYVKLHLLYADSISSLNSLINESVTFLEDSVSDDSEGVKKLIKAVESAGSITKPALLKKLGWGPRIPFTRIKRKAMKIAAIYDIVDAQAVYSTFLK